MAYPQEGVGYKHEPSWFKNLKRAEGGPASGMSEAVGPSAIAERIQAEGEGARSHLKDAERGVGVVK